MSAGIETTRNTFVSGVLELIRQPEQFRRLRNDKSLLQSAVEEFLRFSSPVVHMMRTVSRDVELAGKPLRSGDRVVLWNPSANRDERVFRDPDLFDISRTPNPHISFGYGIHSCMGAHLARLELRLMLEELVDRMQNIKVTAEPKKLQSNWLSGYKTMPIRFDRAA
jgi:cytochrome P450